MARATLHQTKRSRPSSSTRQQQQRGSRTDFQLPRAVSEPLGFTMALYHLSALALALLVAAATALGDLDFPSTDHPFRNYNGAGTRFGNLGDIESAEPNFRAATVHSPHRADV